MAAAKRTQAAEIDPRCSVSNERKPPAAVMTSVPCRRANGSLQPPRHYPTPANGLAGRSR